MNNSFFCLHASQADNTMKRVALLKEACDELDVPFFPVDSVSSDYSALPELHPSDMLFNTSRGSEHLETLLRKQGVVTFENGNSSIARPNSDTTLLSAAHTRERLPEPKTIHHLPNMPDLLEVYVEHLGGFPVVLKQRANSRGEGILYCGDMPTLILLAWSEPEVSTIYQ